MFEAKVFVTGVYGSGKTTFVHNYRTRMGTPTFLSFDALFGYSEGGNRLDIVYKALNGLSSFVMDALPLASDPESWPRFLEYVHTHECTIVLVCCDIDLWYTSYLANKKSFTQASEAQHKSWFSEFYEGLGTLVCTTCPENVLLYNSGSDTLKPYKVLKPT